MMFGNVDSLKLRQSVSVDLMLATAFLWSTSGMLIKFIPWSSMAIAGMRSIIAASVLFIFLSVMKKKVVINKTVLIGAAAVCIKYITFITANKFTSSANVVALQYTSPIFVILISALFLKTDIKRKDIFVITGISLSICLFIYDGITGGGLFGNVLGLICGVSTALMYIITSRLKTFSESMSTVIMGHTFTGIIGIPFIAVDGLEISGEIVAAILILGILQQAVAYTLYTFAIRNSSAISCSIASSIEPILSPVWVFIFVGELPSVLSAIGASMVLLIVFIWSVSNAASSINIKRFKYLRFLILMYRRRKIHNRIRVKTKLA